MNEKVLIIGGGYAGIMTAVRTARRLGKRAQITLLSDSDRFVERIRLHQNAATQTRVDVPITELLRGTHVEFVKAIATAIDLRSRRVSTGQGEIPYDLLTLAVGSVVDRGAVPGITDHALTLDAGSAARFAERLPAVLAARGRVLVCGGGLTGIEAATEIADAYPTIRVSLATQGSLGDSLSKKAQTYLRRAFARLGVRLLEDTEVRGIHQGEAATSKGNEPFDLCVWAGGMRATPLLKEAGLAVNSRGQALVDAELRSISNPEVYIAGDAADCQSCVAPVLMACKTALPMGAHVGDAIAARLLRRPGEPFRFGDSIQCISLGRGDGLIQLMRPDGAPRERVITGALGARLKELVCRYALFSLRAEARGLLRYRWLKPAPRPALIQEAERPRIAI